MYPQVYVVVKPIIEESLDNSEEMDVDSKSGGPSSKSITETTLANSATALLASINPSATEIEYLSPRLAQALELLNKIKEEHRSRKAIEAIFDAEKSLFERINEAQRGDLPSSLETVLTEYTKQLFTSADHVEHTRGKAAEAIVAMAPIARRGDAIRMDFARGLAAARDLERSGLVLQSLDRALKLLDG